MECDELTALSTVPTMTPSPALVTVHPSRRRLTLAAFVGVALLGLAGVVGWGAAEQTRPSLCAAENGAGECIYEITPLRGDRVHVRIDVENVEPRGEWTMSEACLRPAPPAGACPQWLSDWAGVPKP